MSTNELTIESDNPPQTTTAPGSWRQDVGRVRVIRLALAVTVAMAIAQIFNWPISFVAPVLVVVFLEMPIAEPTLRQTLAYLGYAIGTVAGSFVFVLLFEPYPLIFIPAYTLVIFLSAYYMNKGASLVLIILIMVAFLIMPIVGNLHEGLTPFIAAGMLLSEIVAILVIQLAHGMLPDPPATVVEEASFQPGYSAEAARLALVTAITIVPAMTVFVTVNMPAQLVIMIYIGIIALEGSRATSVYTTKKLLTANAFAGLAALLFYLVIVAVPEVYMLVLMTLLVMLLFAQRRFSDAHDAKYFGSAMIGVIILISTSLGEKADIDTNILLRILFIVIAGIYAIGVTSIVEPLTRPEETE